MNPFPLTVTHRNLALILLKGGIAIPIGQIQRIPVGLIPDSAMNMPQEALKITVENLVMFVMVSELFHTRNL